MRHIAIPTTDAEAVADFLHGMALRSYRFDRYRTTQKESDLPTLVKVTLVADDSKAGQARFATLQAVAEGVTLTRDLVSEPANTLYPEEFARRAGELARLGVDVEVLGEEKMKALGMGALVSGGQGSGRESQLVVMG